MSAYAAARLLVSLYVEDANSAAAASEMADLPLPVVLTSLGELELENAMQLRIFRKEIVALEMRRARAAFGMDVDVGVMTVRPMSEAIYTEARRLASRWTVAARHPDARHPSPGLGDDFGSGELSHVRRSAEKIGESSRLNCSVAAGAPLFMQQYLNIDRVPVASSAIASIGYDRHAAVLEVEFVSGTIYQYLGVTEEIHHDFLNAESKGKFFAPYMRAGGYRYRRIR